jgi:hypothetical protein
MFSSSKVCYTCFAYTGSALQVRRLTWVGKDVIRPHCTAGDEGDMRC